MKLILSVMQKKIKNLIFITVMWKKLHSVHMVSTTSVYYGIYETFVRFIHTNAHTVIYQTHQSNQRERLLFPIKAGLSTACWYLICHAASDPCCIY